MEWKVTDKNLMKSECERCCIQCDKANKCANYCSRKHIGCHNCYEERFYIGTHDGGIDD